MKSVLTVFDNIERYLAIVFTVLMVVLLFLQVVSRYVFKYAFTWTEELAIICFILSVYTGASLAVTRRQHLRIKILHTMVKPKTEKLMDIVCNAVFAAVMLVLGKGMYAVVANLHKYHVKYIASGVPKFWVYGAIWIAFYFMVIRLIQDSVKLVKEYREMQ